MLETPRFFHQFAALLRAGFSVQQALTMAGKDCSAGFQKSLRQTSLQVEAGQSLAEALSRSYFDPWSISLIRSAEYSGALAEVCDRLAVAIETQQQQQKLYGSAMVSVLVIAFSLLAWAIVLLGQTLLQPGFVVVCLILIGLLLWNNRGGGLQVAGDLGKGTHQFLAKVPMLQGILEARSLLYLAELELPLRCGIPIVQAVELIRPRIPDERLAQAMAVASRQLDRGVPLSRSLEGKISPVALQLIRTGEETGNIDEMLHKLGQYAASDLESRLKQLQGILRPLGLVAAGSLVLLFGMQMVRSLIERLPG